MVSRLSSVFAWQSNGEQHYVRRSLVILVSFSFAIRFAFCVFFMVFNLVCIVFVIGIIRIAHAIQCDTHKKRTIITNAFAHTNVLDKSTVLTDTASILDKWCKLFFLIFFLNRIFIAWLGDRSVQYLDYSI